MCARYEPPLRFLFVDHDGVGVEIDSPVQDELFPRKEGYFVRQPLAADAGDDAVPRVEPVTGRWGLISWLTRPDNLASAEKLATHNARDDRVAKSFTFGNAWRKAQHCIVPAQAFWEPRLAHRRAHPCAVHIDRRRALRHRRALGHVKGRERGAARELHDSHDQRGHAPAPAQLPPDQGREADAGTAARAQWAEWLDAPEERSMGFVSQYPAERMIATGHPVAPKTKAVPAKRAAPKPLPIQGELL